MSEMINEMIKMNIQDVASLPEILVFDRVSSGPEYDGKADTYRIRYKSDDCEVEGYFAAPKDMEGPLPAIIFNRGGNREFGKLLPGTISRYAAYGYVCLGTQYRGNCGGTGLEEFGGAEVNDAIKLIDIALKLPFVRKEGVYMAGHSRGGMTTYIACARDHRIKAAAIGAGLADSFIMFGRKKEPMAEVYLDLVGATPEQKPEEYVKRSATMWADKIIPPILICQGTDDWRVEPEQAYKMDRALAAAGKEHKLIVYEGADHSLAGTSYIQDVVNWFKAHPLDE